LLGRGNSGKSSLANVLAGRRAASVSRQPGHTQRLQTLAVSGSLYVRDTPALDTAPLEWAPITSIPCEPWESIRKDSRETSDGGEAKPSRIGISDTQPSLTGPGEAQVLPTGAGPEARPSLAGPADCGAQETDGQWDALAVEQVCDLCGLTPSGALQAPG
jgi:hypothetical protein